MAPVIPAGWSATQIVTKRGIPWWIRIEGFKEKYAPDASNSVVLALTPFATRGTFIEDMIGYSTVIGEGTTSPKLSRQLPERNAWAAWQTGQDCNLIEAFTNPTPSASRSNWLEYDWAVYQVVFQGNLFQVIEDAQVPHRRVDGTREGEAALTGTTDMMIYAEEWLRHTMVQKKAFTRNQLIPGGTFVLDDGSPNPAQIGETRTVLAKEFTYVVTWLDVPLTQALEDRAALTGDAGQLLATLPPLANVFRYGNEVRVTVNDGFMRLFMRIHAAAAPRVVTLDDAESVIGYPFGPFPVVALIAPEASIEMTGGLVPRQ